jgi:excisionase family DNA binding protein
MSGNTDHETPAAGTTQADRTRTYSVKEAARELSLSPRSTWDLVWSKRLPAKRSGGRVVVTAEALDAYIAALPDYEPKAKTA